METSGEMARGAKVNIVVQKLNEMKCKARERIANRMQSA